MAADEVQQPNGLRVKNTFLELIDPDWPLAAMTPLPGQLVRAHTAPALVELVANVLVDGDGARLAPGVDPSEACAQTARGRSVAGEAAAAAADAAPVPARPPPPSRTCPESGTSRGPAGPPVPPGHGVQDGTPFLPQTVRNTVSPSTSRHRMAWAVDARKLKGNDKQAVSPSFELLCGGRLLPFKLMIYTKQVTDQKGGASFRKSQGKGNIAIKCEADLTDHPMPLEFWICIGNGETQQPARGPIIHDFSHGAVCMLPNDEWDFSSVVDQASSTFMVCLEVQL